MRRKSLWCRQQLKPVDGEFELLLALCPLKELHMEKQNSSLRIITVRREHGFKKLQEWNDKDQKWLRFPTVVGGMWVMGERLSGSNLTKDYCNWLHSPSQPLQLKFACEETYEDDSFNTNDLLKWHNRTWNPNKVSKIILTVLQLLTEQIALASKAECICIACIGTMQGGASQPPVKVYDQLCGRCHHIV